MAISMPSDPLGDLRRQKNDINTQAASSLNEALDILIKTDVLPNLTYPTFLTEFPNSLGGPAKPINGRPQLKQRCEAFIGGLEIANMSSHLNDMVQLRDWHNQTLAQKQSIMPNAAAVIDESLFDFLGRGFPDSAIVGIGIDRLSMLATNSESIRDVIPFPFDLM